MVCRRLRTDGVACANQLLQEMLHEGKLKLGEVGYRYDKLCPRIPSFLNTKFPASDKAYAGRKFATAAFNELERFVEKLENDQTALETFFKEVVKGSKSALPLPKASAVASASHDIS